MPLDWLWPNKSDVLNKAMLFDRSTHIYKKDEELIIAPIIGPTFVRPIVGGMLVDDQRAVYSIQYIDNSIRLYDARGDEYVHIYPDRLTQDWFDAHVFGETAIMESKDGALLVQIDDESFTFTRVSDGSFHYKNVSYTISGNELRSKDKIISLHRDQSWFDLYVFGGTAAVRLKPGALVVQIYGESFTFTPAPDGSFRYMDVVYDINGYQLQAQGLVRLLPRDQSWFDTYVFGGDIASVRRRSYNELSVEIDNRRYLFKARPKRIGKGAYGSVHCYDCVNDAEGPVCYALKTFEKEIDAKEEIDVWKETNVSNCNVVQARITDGPRPSVLMPMMDGDLLSVKNWSDTDIVTIIDSVIEQVRCVNTIADKHGHHQYGYLDIKPANVLFKRREDGGLSVRLGDMGSIVPANHTYVSTYPCYYCRSDVHWINNLTKVDCQNFLIARLMGQLAKWGPDDCWLYTPSDPQAPKDCFRQPSTRMALKKFLSIRYGFEYGDLILTERRPVVIGEGVGDYLTNPAPILIAGKKRRKNIEQQNYFF